MKRFKNFCKNNRGKLLVVAGLVAVAVIRKGVFRGLRFIKMR